MSGMDGIVRNLTIETLAVDAPVGATGHDEEWIDVGSPVRMVMDNRFLVYYDLTVNDSTGVKLRIVPRKTQTGPVIPAFVPAMDTWILGSDDDAKWIQFISDAFLWLQVQVQAVSVGIAPGTISVDITRVRV